METVQALRSRLLQHRKQLLDDMMRPIEGTLLYIYDSSDEQGTLATQPEDDYYGSDFSYMFHLQPSEGNFFKSISLCV